MLTACSRSQRQKRAAARMPSAAIGLASSPIRASEPAKRM